MIAIAAVVACSLVAWLVVSDARGFLIAWYSGEESSFTPHLTLRFGLQTLVNLTAVWMILRAT